MTDDAAGAAVLARVAVWDAPVRIVHWLIALAIPALWWTAENDEMDWHMRIGIAVLAMLTFRILWGFAGSSTARFGNFLRGPATVAAYLRGRASAPVIGHNPLGALSVVALLALTALQVGLGLFSGDPDDGVEGPLNAAASARIAGEATDLHETVFYVLLAFVALHIAAITYYRIVKRQELVGPMITGRAMRAANTAGLTRAPAWRAYVCTAASVIFAWWIWTGAPPLT